MREWIAFAVVLLIPVLVTGDRGRRWLTERSLGKLAWGFLAGFTAIGIAASLWLFAVPARKTALALVLTPLLQAIVFVVFDKSFQLSVGRPPVSFDDARFGRRIGGSSQWQDILFWVVTYVVLPLIGIVVFVEFGIDLPSRNHR